MVQHITSFVKLILSDYLANNTPITQSTTLNDSYKDPNIANIIRNLPGTLPINTVAEYTIYTFSQSNSWLGSSMRPSYSDLSNPSIIWTDFANGSISYNSITKHVQLYGSASSPRIPYRQSVIDYMASEFSNNSSSAQVKGMQSLNSISNALSGSSTYASKKFLAFATFAGLVKTGGIWDHKQPVKDLSNGQEWSMDYVTRKTYEFEAWSNMHYGYIGRLAGFSEFELLNAAGFAQLPTSPNFNSPLSGLGSQFDDPLDQNAIKEGFKLYDLYRDGITSNQFIDYLRNDSNLHTSYGSPI